MSITDPGFDAELDRIVNMIRGSLARAPLSEFFTTVYLVYGDELTVNLLFPASPGVWSRLKTIILGLLGRPDSSSGVSDPYDLVYQFGLRIGRTRHCPDAVFVADEAEEVGGSEAILVLGYTADGRANYAELSVERTPDNSIHVAGVRAVHLADGVSISCRRNAAQEVLRGFEDAVKR